MTGEQRSQFARFVHFSRGEPRSIDEEEIFVAMFFDRLIERRRCLHHVAADAQNSRECSQLVRRGDAIHVDRENVRGSS